MKQKIYYNTKINESNAITHPWHEKTVQVPVKWDPLGNFPHLMIGKSLYLADDRVIKEV